GDAVSAKLLLRISRIDNGYLVEYPTGEQQKFVSLVWGEGAQDVMGTRYAMSPSEAGDMTKAMLERLGRMDADAAKKLALEEDCCSGSFGPSSDSGGSAAVSGCGPSTWSGGQGLSGFRERLG